MNLTRKFNGRLGGIGNGPNFVDHRLCERVQAVLGEDVECPVPAELDALAQEVDALYTNWCNVVQRYNEQARALRNRATTAMQVILEEEDA